MTGPTDPPSNDNPTTTGTTGTDDGGQDDGPDVSVFGEHADYVTQLRSEAAERRRRLREAEESLTAEQTAHRTTHARLVEAEVHRAAAGIMADPGDLLLHVQAADVLDDDGQPDVEKIKKAATDLVATKPHLAARSRKVVGDVDQGARDTGPASFGETFAGMLKKAAG